MNYAAHLLATYPNKQHTVGNLLGDMIRNRELKDLDPAVRTGVQIHRQIDSFTDNHPVVRKLVALLRPRHRKYSPVVLDILFDVALVRNWQRFSDTDFDAFTTWVYDLIPESLGYIPERLHIRLTRMASGKWLNQYDTQAGLKSSLEWMDHRTSFPSNFHLATMDWEEHGEAITNGLIDFYNQLRNALAE